MPLPAFVPLIASGLLAAAGTGLQMRAQNKAAKRQRDALQFGLQRQDQFQEQANQAVMDRTNEFDPQTQEVNRQAHGDAILDRLNQDLQRTRAEGPGQIGQGVEGQVSSNAFRVAQARATGEQAQSAAEMARLMSQVGAHQRLRQDQAIGNADLASRLNVIAGGANQAAQTDRLRAQQAGRVGLGGVVGGGLLRGAGAALGAGLS